MSDKNKHNYPKVTLLEPGIVEIDYGYHGIISLASIQSVYNKHIALNLKGKQAVLIVAESLVRADNEAQRFASNSQVSAITLASAIVVKSFLERNMGNMFMRYQHPPYPSQLFETRDKAIKWLRKEIIENTKPV